MPATDYPVIIWNLIFYAHSSTTTPVHIWGTTGETDTPPISSGSRCCWYKPSGDRDIIRAVLTKEWRWNIRKSDGVDLTKYQQFLFTPKREGP